MAARHEADGLVVLAVNAWDEPRKQIQRFVTEKQLRQRVLLDGGTVFEEYGGRGVPTTYWIDRQGIIVNAAVGYTSKPTLMRKTDDLVASE